MVRTESNKHLRFQFYVSIIRRDKNESKKLFPPPFGGKTKQL